jgi:hypothetical protein
LRAPAAFGSSCSPSAWRGGRSWMPALPAGARARVALNLRGSSPARCSSPGLSPNPTCARRCLHGRHIPGPGLGRVTWQWDKRSNQLDYPADSRGWPSLPLSSSAFRTVTVPVTRLDVGPLVAGGRVSGPPAAISHPGSAAGASLRLACQGSRVTVNSALSSFPRHAAARPSPPGPEQARPRGPEHIIACKNGAIKSVAAFVIGFVNYDSLIP